MFKKINFQNFRGFKNIEIDGFKRFNILVGKNNCGKSSILEGIFLLVNPSNPELPLKINSLRDINMVDETFWKIFFNELEYNSSIKLKGYMINPRENRTLKIDSNSSSSIKSSSEENGVDQTKIDFGYSHSGLSSKLNGLKYEYQLKKDLNKSYKVFNASVIEEKSGLKVNYPQDYSEQLNGLIISSNKLPSDNWNRFDKIQISKKKSSVVKVLQNLEPCLVDMSMSSNKIIYCDIGMENLIPMNMLGDGFCRFFSIVLAIYEAKDGIVLIDELENGLHYSSQKLVWEAILAAAEEYKTQVFIATHSYECISALSSVVEENSSKKDEIRLFRIEKTDQIVTAIPYDYEEIKISLDKNWEVR